MTAESGKNEKPKLWTERNTGSCYKTLPRPIRNDKELEAFTGALLELYKTEKPSREERELADLLPL